jgi:hypothetical protein
MATEITQTERKCDAPQAAPTNRTACVGITGIM